MASNCHKLFVSHSEDKVEISIDTLLKQMDLVLNEQPHVLELILNTSQKGMRFGALLILKQACFSRSLCTKSNIASEQVHAIIKASLILLYIILPDLIAAKKDITQLTKYKKSLLRCSAISFKFAKKLNITDNITLKLLSQISATNTYFNTNSYIQTLTITSLNCTLLAFTGFKDKLTYSHALSRLLTYQDGLQIKQLALQTHKLELSKLCTPITDFNGSLVRLKNKNLALVVGQSPFDLQFGIFEFSQTSLSEPSGYKHVEKDQIRILLPHQIVEHTKLIPLFESIKETLEANPESLAKTKTKKSISGINRYSANNSWRVISQSFATNNKALCKILASYPEQSQLLLDYATKHNRQNQEITDVKHAIAMLGNAQLFPTLCNDNIKVKQKNVTQMGCDVVNYKIDLFSHILSELHHQTNIGLPKYHELIGRLLIIALMTIPKVSYAASTPARLAKPNASKTASLAELFGLTTIDNWQKISLILSKSWLLPTKYNRIIEQYFALISMRLLSTGQSSATPEKPVDKESRLLNENTLLIIVATYFFQHLINGENTLTPNPAMDNLMGEFKTIKPNAEQLYTHVCQSITCLTPLS
jgi:hypothetical protein